MNDLARLVGQAVYEDTHTILLGLTMLLAVVYLYSAVYFWAFNDMYNFPDISWPENPDCTSLLTCARDHIQYGVHNPPVWKSGTNFYGWIFAVSFFFFITMFLSEMVVAFLMDTFWKVKALSSKIDEQRFGQCFICGEDETALRLLYKKEMAAQCDILTQKLIDQHCKNTAQDISKKDQMKLQWRATSIVESNILHEHANGSHNMWIWVFFYLWAKDQEEKEHQHDFTGIKLRGEVLWLLSQISNGSTDIFPVHMKARSDDIWLTGPFTQATSVDVRIACDRIEHALLALHSDVTRLCGQNSLDGNRNNLT